jgi:hypothetical protein
MGWGSGMKSALPPSQAAIPDLANDRLHRSRHSGTLGAHGPEVPAAFSRRVRVLDLGDPHQDERDRPLRPDGPLRLASPRDAGARPSLGAAPPRGAFTRAHLRRTPLPGARPRAPPDHLDPRRPDDGGRPGDPHREPGPDRPPLLPVLARQGADQRAEVAGTALAVAGLVTLSVKDALSGGGSPAGDAMCFALDAPLRALPGPRRRNRDFPSIWLYVIPVYAQAPSSASVAASPDRDLRVWVRPRVGAHGRPRGRAHRLRPFAPQRGHAPDPRPDRQPVQREPVRVRGRPWATSSSARCPARSSTLASAIVVAGVAIVVFATPSAAEG